MMTRDETHWTYDSYHDKWDCGECDQAFQFMCGGPEENQYRYCPACGREIVLEEADQDE